MSRPYSFLLDDLAEYLGLEKKEVALRLQTASEDIAIDFLKVNPQTPEELIEWYKNTPYYIYDLTNFTAERILNGQIDEIVTLCGGAVLDYGCGIGEVAIRCAEKGCYVVAMELRGPTMDYFKWRVEKRNLDIEIKEIYPPVANVFTAYFDNVVCLDVLEHVPKPFDLISLFWHMLAEGGKLILTTFFHQGYFLPMHLKSNEWLAEAFPQEMEKRGWGMCYGTFDGTDKIHVWRFGRK